MLTQRLSVFLLLSLSLPHIPATSRTKTRPSLADQRCPCKEASNCDMKFAKMNPAAHFAVLKFIPACPSFQGRCCTAEMMLLTIIDLSQAPSPPPLLNPRHNNHHSVTCVPVKDCPANNIYGTNSLHFEQFGFISPSESDCQATQDNILCIVSAQTQDTKTVQTQDTKSRTGELPCVHPSSCSEVYGVAPSHFTDHGLQFACPDDQEVRCLAVQPAIISTTTSPTPTASELPCLPPSLCSEVYGTLGSHFTDYGLQFKCARTEHVRCIVGAQPTTTSSTSAQVTTIPVPSTGELPCLNPSSCAEVYGTIGSHFTNYGLQFKCPLSDQVRCVVSTSTAISVETINLSTTIQSTTMRTTSSTTSTQATSPSTAELPCLNPSSCAEVYGTIGSHFTIYGLQFRCPKSEQVRCVGTTSTAISVETTKRTTTRPSKTKQTTTEQTQTKLQDLEPSTAELPCRHPSSCAEVYGTIGSHFTAYGLQFRCPSNDQVRCVRTASTANFVETTRRTTTRRTTTRRTTTRRTTTRRTTTRTTTASLPSTTRPQHPEPSTAELPCLNPSSCVEVYGTLGSHFTDYGLQFRCPDSNQVRCVISGSTKPITTRPITTRQTTRRPTTTIYPLFTTAAPVTAQPPSVVNIIGPRPIYIGINNNQGPAFHQVGSSQSLSIHHTDKKEQIRNLLELLDERLKQIIKKYPKQD